MEPADIKLAGMRLGEQRGDWWWAGRLMHDRGRLSARVGTRDDWLDGWEAESEEGMARMDYSM